MTKMITIASVQTETELCFLRMALESNGIPFLVVGEHFGGLWPGISIASYNQRVIRVHASDAKRAREIVDELRRDSHPAPPTLGWPSKLRMILESLMFGWFVPGNTRHKGSKGE